MSYQQKMKLFLLFKSRLRHMLPKISLEKIKPRLLQGSK